MKKKRIRYQVAILRAQEIEKKIDDILGTPPPRSTFFPMGYCSLADSMRPIEPILDYNVTPHNPGQTTNPTASHIMFVSNRLGSSAPGHNIQLLFHQYLLVPRGNARHDLCYLSLEL